MEYRIKIFRLSKESSRSGTNRRSRNCVDLILDYCENNLGIESARTRVKIEKMYWLGKQKDDILKPRPVVVEFTKFADRELIRIVSERFKGT
jgi:hypothetical protein